MVVLLTQKNLSTDLFLILQEIVQGHFKDQIRYELTGEEGPDHNKSFHVAVYIGEKQWGTGTGRTKKAAEQEAAYQSILKLHQENIK